MAKDYSSGLQMCEHLSCKTLPDSAFTELVFAPGPMRFELSVSSRSHSKTGEDITSSEKRQRQFPSARPGTFIRLPMPKSRRSCNGAIASPATDDQARRIKAGAASSLPPNLHFR